MLQCTESKSQVIFQGHAAKEGRGYEAGLSQRGNPPGSDRPWRALPQDLAPAQKQPWDGFGISLSSSRCL